MGETHAPRPEPEGRSSHHLVRTAEGWAPDEYRDDMPRVLEAGVGRRIYTARGRQPSMPC